MLSRESVHGGVRKAMAEIEDDIVALSLDLHANPETAFEERYASSRLVGWLRDEGFEVEESIAGLPTAFVGRVGTGERPRIAFLMEYDALPKIGHACGHNLIAAGGVAAATALHRALPDPDGTILAIGTPGEEGAGGKVFELEAGVFDGVDAALMFHPGVRTWPWRHATAIAHLKVAFFGKAAHAAGNPQGGRNALAAMIQFFVALDALRQHVPETARLHGIITNGGAAPNVVPDYTEASYLVRALTTQKTLELVERVEACAEGAARATGTRVRGRARGSTLHRTEEQPHDRDQGRQLPHGGRRRGRGARPQGRHRFVGHRQRQPGPSDDPPLHKDSPGRRLGALGRVQGGRLLPTRPGSDAPHGRGPRKHRRRPPDGPGVFGEGVGGVP